MKPEAGNLLALHLIVALVVAMGLPLGLLLLAARPAWLDRAAAVAARRRTATVLWGAAVFVATVVGLAICTRFRALGVVAVALLVAVSALFYAGFAAGAWVQGRAMLSRDGGASCMVWGWLARAGAVAVPIVGWVLGAYFVALALGTPVAAWLSPAADDAGNDTTDPSDGSTPAS